MTATPPSTIDLLARIEELEAHLAEVGSAAPASGDRVRVARRGRRLAGIALATVALASMPLVALASHQFSDVPTGHLFHLDISRIKGAGITDGCSATTYCPNAAVTRGQMAAFLARTAPRVARSIFTNQLSSSTFVSLAEPELTPPGVSGHAATIRVDVEVQGSVETKSNCPCVVEVALFQGDQQLSFTSRYLAIDAAATSNLTVDATSFSFAGFAPTDVATGWDVRARRVAGDSTFALVGSIFVTSYAFGPTGDPLP